MHQNNNSITRLRKKFRLALTACDLNYASFGRQFKVGRQYISQVMDGKLPVSPRIEKEIRDFTRTNMVVVQNIINEPID